MDDALGKAQSAGITLEDHAGDVIHANLVDALATLFADVKQVEDPLLEQFKRTNDSLQSIALDFTRISQGIVIKFGLQAGTVHRWADKIRSILLGFLATLKGRYRVALAPIALTVVSTVEKTMASLRRRCHRRSR